VATPKETAAVRFILNSSNRLPFRHYRVHTPNDLVIFGAGPAPRQEGILRSDEFSLNKKIAERGMRSVRGRRR
jgi:hypothetical protein